MFGKKKEKLSPNQKAELKAQKLEKKLEKKKQKLLGPKEKKVSAVRKHITALPFMGSKIITGFSGFLAAAAFYQFEVPQDYKFAGILAGATLLSSAIGAAPYMKSVSRTNKTLATVVDSLDKIDAAVGSQQQLVAQVISQVESYMQGKGIAPEIQHIKNLKNTVNGLPSDISGVGSAVNAIPGDISSLGSSLSSDLSSLGSFFGGL